MPEPDRLAETFEQNRAHLRAVASRMLGSITEADDAVQEAWLRLSRSDANEVGNLGGWLTTVVSRICLDMLRSRTSRREESLDVRILEPVVSRDDAANPESEALLADAIGPALLVVLETLSPAERVSFVLHDLFAMPFEDIAVIVGRSATATRQLASRGRRRVQGARATSTSATRQREVVGAFLAASRGGDFAALLAVLDPDVVLRRDTDVHGAQAVAETFFGRAQAAQHVLVGGVAGLVWAPNGVPRVVFKFTVSGDVISEIELIGDPDRMRALLS